MIRIGIFGGSFNPIHIGHIGLAGELCAKGYVDEVWLMVSPHNPLKEQDSLLDENIRLELARMAVEGIPHVLVSDFEFRLPRPSYMYQTLKELSSCYPDRQFHLIIGADNWLCFDKWKNASSILRHYPIVVYPRPGYPAVPFRVPEEAYRVTLAHDMPLFTVSSTEIREMIREGTDLTPYLPSCVIDEIHRKGLYKNMVHGN